MFIMSFYRRSQIFNGRLTLWLSTIFFVLFFVGLYGSGLLGKFYLDLGVLNLISVLFAPEQMNEARIADAEKNLRYALKYDNINHQTIWRSLGYISIAQGKEEQAIKTWRNAEGVAEEFVLRGEYAQKSGQYQEALKWYQWSAKIKPEWADPWYFIGLTYEDISEWQDALNAYAQINNDVIFTSIGRSSPYYRQGLIYQRREEPRQLESAMTAYEKAIEINNFSNNLEAANCHYERGEILRWTNEAPEEYIAEYQQAIKLNPHLASAYIYLGVAYYIKDGDAAKAEAEIRKALILDPQNQWAYYHLGEIYRQEENITEAVIMYKQALKNDPDFKIAQEKLQALIDN